MTTLAVDDFSGVANPLGGFWVTMTSEAAFQKNETASPADLASDCGAYDTSATWPPDQWAQAKVSVTGGSGEAGIGIMLRAAEGVRTYYRAQVNKAGSNNVNVEKRIAGAMTALAALTTVWLDEDVLYLEVIGDTLKVFQNGSQLGSDIAGDAAIAAGRAGVAYSSTCTAASLNDWRAGDFTTPETPELPQRTPLYLTQIRQGGP